mmetsp:Transcript_2191/g.6188  ORF Transcript_2191/g.6188 Transcript_2191/m.6188 type:complete len:254 (-) Transcript_2191:310-1071(-)
MRTEAISAKALCRASPSSSGMGPNFQVSPWLCSKSARTWAQDSPPRAAPEAERRRTARTGRSLARVSARLCSTAWASRWSCSSKLASPGGLPMVSTKTRAVLSASRRLEHVGTFLPKATGWKTIFVSFCAAAPALPGAGVATAQRQRKARGALVDVRAEPLGLLGLLWPVGERAPCLSSRVLGSLDAARLLHASSTARSAVAPAPTTTKLKRYCTSASTSGTLERKALLSTPGAGVPSPPFCRACFLESLRWR